MGHKFDPERPHGVVIGDSEGRFYHQDGVYFDKDGFEHGLPLKAKAAQQKAAVVAVDDDQVSKQATDA